MSVATKPNNRLRRRRRVRAKVRGTAERPRLSVLRSNRGVMCQLIDDVAGHTLAAVSWIEPDGAHRAVDALMLLAHTARPPSRTPSAKAFTRPWYW